MSQAADLLSLECCFVLFLFSGRFKGLPELTWVPVDLTVVLLVITLVVFARDMLGGRIAMRFGACDALFAFFAITAWLSITWSSFDSANIDKLIRFILFTIPAYFMASALSAHAAKRECILRLIVAVSIAMLAYYYFYRFILGINPTLMNADGDRTALQADNYLEYSAHAQYLFTIFVVYVVFSMDRPILITSLWSILWLAALVLIGGRGSLVFGVLTVPIVAIALMLRPATAARQGRRLLTYLAAVTLLGLAGYYTLDVGDENPMTEDLLTVQRLSWDLSGQSTFSMDARRDSRNVALSLWEQKPLFGWGVGEFRLKHWLQYPHNSLIEALVELGIVGAATFVVLCALVSLRSIYCLRLGSLRWQSVAIIVLFLTELSSHFTVQGYLPDDRIFFALMGLASGLSASLAADWSAE